MNKKTIIAIAGVLLVGGAATAAYVGLRDRGPRPYRAKRARDLKSKFKVINVHEHIKSKAEVPKLLKAMDELGVVMTVLVASPKQTTVGGKYGWEGWAENSEEILAIAKEHPDRFVPFMTIGPDEPDAVKKLQDWRARGAKGVKLYTGHSTFYKLKRPDGKGGFTETPYPLDHASMLPIFEWAEKEQFPINWHVNSGTYDAEFRRVMDHYPKLRVDCPHHCMALGNLDRIREYFRAYPNLSMDTSHGYHEFMAGALRQISRRGDQFKALYTEFPDRFLWGQDSVITSHKKKTTPWIKRIARAYFGLFGRDEFKLPIYDKKYKFQREEVLPGLALPESFLRKMYEENPRRFLHLPPK